jgi:MFS family permease
LYGGHRVLPLSNLIFAAGLALLASAHGAATLIASWLVIGIGMSGGLYEAAFSTLARIHGRDARRSITGITLIAGFASTVCWPLSAWMEASLGWRATCAVWAIVHLAACVPLNLSLPASRADDRLAPDAPGEPAGTRQWPVMIALSFVFAATWFTSTAMAAHLPRVLQDAGSSLTAAIAAGALVGPAQVAARVFEFSLMRRAHPLISARLASLAHPVGAGVFLATGAPAPVFTVMHGAGNGVMTIANGTLPLVLFGAGGYGLRQGILNAPARLIQAAAPFLFDLLLTRIGAMALGLTAALGIASFIVLMAIPAGKRVTL